MWRFQNDHISFGITRRLYKAFLFFCLWNSRADEQHYLVKNWSARKDLTPGSHNVLNSSLIERSKILLPSLRIKFGPAKQFVKALKPTSHAFCHLDRCSQACLKQKLKDNIFVGPQIRRVLASEQLEKNVCSERNAWQAFRITMEGFLGNHQRDNYTKTTINQI